MRSVTVGFGAINISKSHRHCNGGRWIGGKRRFAFQVENRLGYRQLAPTKYIRNGQFEESNDLVIPSVILQI